MSICVLGNRIEFTPWWPAQGKQSNATFAFRSAYAEVAPQHPWIAPAYVLGAACDDQQGRFIQRQHLHEFFDANRGSTIAMHQAPLELQIIDAGAAGLKVYDWVESDQAWDTQLPHRLLLLGREGRPSRADQSSLEHCLANHLKIYLDQQRHDIRHGKAIEEIMITATQEVVPDVRIRVDVAARDRWRKTAEPQLNFRAGAIARGSSPVLEQPRRSHAIT